MFIVLDTWGMKSNFRINWTQQFLLQKTNWRIILQQIMLLVNVIMGVVLIAAMQVHNTDRNVYEMLLVNLHGFLVGGIQARMTACECYRDVQVFGD